MINEKLKILRRDIEKIDKELFKIIIKREQIIDKISKIKKKNMISIVDLKREKELIKKINEKTKHQLNKNYIKEIYNVIFKYSKLKQKNDRSK
jgi:chorismate mutase|tara:strand:+ start:437 stop:715 length:279 start_codon:yes stop_codon:yes gene_type:complete